MRFKLLDACDKELFESDMIKILTEADGDFVPPLSKRSSTLDKSFSSEAVDGGGIESYFAEMKKQEIVAVFENGKIIGFVSYRLNFTSDEIAEYDSYNLYVSTLVLGNNARGKGITKKLYSHIFNELYPERNIFTRTWSTNLAHIKILNSFGFNELVRKIVDRGKGIDTGYYKKDPIKPLRCKEG